MELNIWTKNSGYSLGIINERTIVNLALPVTYSNTFDDSTSVIFTIIAGQLPPGLRIDGDKIVGTAFEVPRYTLFRFVIRAEYNGEISDRTYQISVVGSDEPVWLTSEGPLPVGPNDAYYILDSSYIEFQLAAIDFDTAAGQELKFFVASGDGELPPGLTLLENGIILGWVQPTLAIPSSAGNGRFDTGVYDVVAYDFGYRSSNGFDSFGYDAPNYDYSTESLSPKKINRNFEFIVTITDGDTYVKRKFRIFVVGDDFFRADNTITRTGSGTFSADISYVRAPIWTTPSNLGIFRANNYVTFKLDTYDGLVLGPVTYTLDNTNPDLTPSVIPPGMLFDQGTGELFGVVPYQPAVTKNYKFTVTATRLSDSEETAYSKRTFNVKLLGEVESAMQWVTDSDIGSIEANLVSTFSIKATSTLANSNILYVITSGQLPPGLTLNLDGEIVGKVPQFGTTGKPGIIRIDSGDFTLDNSTTTLDREYRVVVEARDIAEYSAISKEFVIKVAVPNDRQYSNMVVRPFLKKEQRELFKTFITDSTIFDINSIYRPSDPNFGIQTELKMLVFAGIETKTAAEVVSVVGQNHKPKRFKLGEIKKAQAKEPGTDNVIYEIVYVDVIDPLEIGDKHLDLAIGTSEDPYKLTVDQTNIYYNGPFNTSERYWGAPKPYSASVDRNDTYLNLTYRQPASVALWRKRIKQLGLRERNYLPLWMRTIQDGNVQELDYVKAIPLCYCKPGTSDNILLKIKNYFKNNDFIFNQIDYVIDRYIIDSVTGYNTDKYIVFRNDKTTIA
jgi:hypothetical protein